MTKKPSKRGLQWFAFRMVILGLTCDCVAQFRSGQLSGNAEAFYMGHQLNPDGVVLDWPPHGEFLPAQECMNLVAVECYNEPEVDDADTSAN